MALVRGSALVDGISGAIAGAVFVQGRGGAYVSARPPRTNRQTGKQLAARLGMQRSLARWDALTDAQRGAWALLGARIPRRDRLGRQSTYSGRSLFLRQNSSNGRIRLALQNDPPSLGLVIGLERATITCVSGVITLRIFRQGGTGSGWLMVKGARSHSSSGYSYKSPTVFYATSFSSNAVLDISAIFAANFGAPGVGELIMVEVSTRFDNCLWGAAVVAKTKAV